jgi:23S rRNA pseudouridine1911/1915/1917 synthase
MKADTQRGKAAETHFRALQTGEKTSLVEARPFTGRTHQIRVHLAESGCPVVGDELYGPQPMKKGTNLGLRAVCLAYVDPFTRRRTEIRAPVEAFCREYGFDLPIL